MSRERNQREEKEALITFEHWETITKPKRVHHEMKLGVNLIINEKA